MREASSEWPRLAERCVHTLEHKRVKFRDITGRCAVAATGAEVAAVGLCVFAAPEIVAGAVMVMGAVVVAAAIQEGIDAYERNASRERAKPKTQTRPSRQQEFVTKRESKPEGLGRDRLPPVTSEPSERPECTPVPVPHRGGNDPHDDCADKVPNNSFPGWDVLVNGKQFDALQLAMRTLWDVKTDDFEKQPLRSQRFFVRMKLPELRHEAKLARECGYDFIIGVRSAAHKAVLFDEDPPSKLSSWIGA
ncbi:DUF6310 domain-containing protein [Stigmatella aurantiaca]|uniref:DUF6310 domain-containing protein n=1 Tax=Stigmatella aurantiaca TaxID=41 RepID=UPI001E3F3B0E|nr:DUF6310 domain-containing protein [Stigmatella aurantiaca]